MAHKSYTAKFQAKSDIFYGDMTASRFRRYVEIFMISYTNSYDVVYQFWQLYHNVKKSLQGDMHIMHITWTHGALFMSV